MDSRLLLVKAITLAFRETQLPNRTTDNSSVLIKDILATIKVPEIFIEGDFTKEIIGNLKASLSWLLETPLDEPVNKGDLLQRIRVNVGQEESLYQAILDGINPDLAENEIRDLRSTIRDDLYTHLKKLRIKDILKTYSAKVNFQEESVDWRHIVKEVVADLEPYRDVIDSTKHSSVVEDFDFTNLDTIRGAMSVAQSELSNEGVMRFGNQGINRMFGSALGARRGETILINALPHNFKSGMSLMLMKQLMLYNTPFMRDPSKKPMVMRISFENKNTDDLYWLYQSLIENEPGAIAVDLSTVSHEEVVCTVADRLQKTGYTLSMCRIDPSEFTYHDIFDRITDFENKGYEIHALFVDYLNMASKKGCNTGPHGVEVRDLFRRVRNFTAKRGITFFTPHQLSTQAKELLRIHGAENFVQEIANKGYYDSCKTIDNEVDFEMYIHIVKVNGVSYLAVQRGKHRKPSITPEKDLYTVLKFDPVGGIRDDINGPDMSRRSIGGNTAAEGGGGAWWG